MDITQIRSGLAAHGAPGRGRRYTPELRAGIRAYISAARESGRSWKSLSQELGVGPGTLHAWAEAPRLAAFVPVVAARTDATLRIRTASGTVLEGLDLETAVRVLRALG